MTTMTEPTTAPSRRRAPSSPTTSGSPTPPPRPPLFLIGSPMGAGGFGTLASHFPDRTIVTYDPRGVERSIKADPATSRRPSSTPTTSTASSRRSAARSTCSPAAAAR